MEATDLHRCFVMDPKTVQVEKMNKCATATKAISTDFKFCSKFCLAPICTCPTLFHQLPTGGCSKYVDEEHIYQIQATFKDFQNKNVKNQR